MKLLNKSTYDNVLKIRPMPSSDQLIVFNSEAKQRRTGSSINPGYFLYAGMNNEHQSFWFRLLALQISVFTVL